MTGVKYGAPSDCIWGGGRTSFGDHDPLEALSLMEKYGISARLTFSNSLLTKKHLSDKKCNDLCRLFDAGSKIRNGVIIYSDLLLDYIKEKYPNLKSKLYPNMRREILNDKCKDMVYEDVLAFINDN